MIFKTRVFVTNSVNFLPQTDEIIILVSGAIAGKGKYDDLLNKNSSFTNFLKKYLEMKEANIKSIGNYIFIT